VAVRAEQERWKGIPDWKKRLMMEQEKKKQADMVGHMTNVAGHVTYVVSHVTYVVVRSHDLYRRSHNS